MDVPENPRPVLGLFKTERQAGAWLTVGGFTAMAAGSWIQGRAAWSIQNNGHSRDFDSYGMTRFTGLSLQLYRRGGVWCWFCVSLRSVGIRSGLCCGLC